MPASSLWTQQWSRGSPLPSQLLLRWGYPREARSICCNRRPLPSVDLVDMALLSPVAGCPSSLVGSRLDAGNSIPSGVFRQDYSFCVLSPCLMRWSGEVAGYRFQAFDSLAWQRELVLVLQGPERRLSPALEHEGTKDRASYGLQSSFFTQSPSRNSAELTQRKRKLQKMTELLFFS